MSPRYRFLAALALSLGCDDEAVAPNPVDAPDAAPPDAAVAHRLCEPEARAGSFVIMMNENEYGDAPFTAVWGGVRSGPDITAAWRVVAGDATCQVLVGPRLLCQLPCPTGHVCAGDDRCVAEPQLSDVGRVTVTGLGPTVSLEPRGGIYEALVREPYPPALPEAEIRLQAAGRDQPFSLAVRAIERLQFPGRDLRVAPGQPLLLTWGAPAATVTSRVHILLDLAAHGGVAAHLECDVPDTGSATIAAGTLAALIDQGVAGFPRLTLTRRSVDAVQIERGCVDLMMASSLDRDISVEGRISCNQADQCPAGQTCRSDLTCR